MRLLFVATLPEPGGACTHTVNLVSALIAAGHSVTVIASHGRGVWEELGERPGLRRVAATFSTAFDEVASAIVERVLAEDRFDHVFAVFEQDYWGSLRVARRLKVPASLFLHHAGMKRTNRLLLPFARPHYIVPSNDLREWIVARRIPHKRVAVLANPIDTEFFQPNPELREAARSTFGFTANDVVIGFVGRLESNKGVIPFAQALNAAMVTHPNVRALWIGSGRREFEVDTVISEAVDPSRHVRRPWTRDVLGALCAMDVLALPSTGRESFGRVLAEAESCEVPVLGSAIGGIPMALEDGVSGMLVPAGDVDAWANAIRRLADDPASRATMGRAGRAFVQSRFDRRAIANELIAYVQTRAK